LWDTAPRSKRNAYNTLPGWGTRYYKGRDMTIRAVLIDVGGPILDEDHEYATWDSFLVELLAQEGIPTGEEELAQLVLAAIRCCARNPRSSVLWELCRPDVARFRRLRDAFREFQRRHLAEHYVRSFPAATRWPWPGISPLGSSGTWRR